jgi:ribonuclease I
MIEHVNVMYHNDSHRRDPKQLSGETKNREKLSRHPLIRFFFSYDESDLESFAYEYMQPAAAFLFHQAENASECKEKSNHAYFDKRQELRLRNLKYYSCTK